MAKNLNMQLTVTADASQAKREMQSLQQQLSKLGSQSYTNMGFGDKFTKDIQKAKSEVAELQVSLRNAFNIDTGKLDFTKFNQQLQKNGKTLQDYSTSLMKLGPEGQQAFLSLAKSVANSEIPIIRVSNRLKEMGTTLKNTIRWQISSSVLHTFVGAIQQAYGYAKDLNASLNNIRIVTGQTTDQMAKFAEYANQSAKALSTTTTNVTNAALIYYQQGLSDEEVRKRTETTIKMANVTKDSAEEVSSQMTAIWNNFAKGSENLEIYADKITALGAATASSSAEIAQGLEKFAAVADTVGLSYDYATSALATVVAQTRQSADIVGTAFKTLFARLESLKLEGSFTDEEGTTVSLNKYSEALERVGVNIFQANGQLKDMDEILDDMGAKWQTLDKNSQVALAQTVGGMRQYNQLIALMDNYDFFKQNVEVARNAEGTLQQQQKIYEESWEAANKRIKASWEALYSDIIEDDFFIKLTDSVSKFLQAIDKIIDRMGGVKGLLLQIAPLVTQLYSKEIANFMSGTFNTARMMIPGQRAAMEKERNTFVQEGLAQAQSTLGKNTAAYTKFESEIKYQETMSKYQNQLSDFDKQYLETLHKQNEARAEELENLEKELEVIKKRNQEAQKGFSKEQIAEGVEGASTKNNLQKFGNNLIVSTGIQQFTADVLDGSVAESAQIGQLRAYLTANKDVLSQTYAEGGLGAGPNGLQNRLDKLTKEYLTEVEKDAPDQGKADEIYEQINALITKYIQEIITGTGDRGKAVTSSVENILNQDKNFKRDTSAAKKAVDTATQDLATKVGTQSTDSSLEEKANQEIISLEASIQARNKEIRALENKATKTDEESNQLDSIKVEQEQQITKLKELKDSLQQYQNAVQDEAQTTEEIDSIKEQQVQLLRDAANAQSEDIARQEEIERRMAELRSRVPKGSQQEEEEAAKRAALDRVGTSERLTAISTALMGITAAANAAGNAIDTLFDPEATGAEKFKAILQSMITIMFQIGNLTRGNTLALIKNTFTTNANTAAEKVNKIATRQAGEAKEKKGQQTNTETSTLNQNTASNNVNSASERAKGGGHKLALWNSQTGSTTALGSVAFVLVTIIAAVKTFTFVMDRFQSAHEENIKKLKEENEAIENWRQENSAALEATHNYSDLNIQLKQGVINQEEYNKQLAETAKQLKVNNAEALAQAGAYDLLEKSTKAAAEKLSKEEYDKALQSDINSRNLMAAGDDSMMQEAMNMAFFGAGDFFGGLSGDYSNYGKTTKRIGTGIVTESGEAALISELRQLNINGVQISDNGDISWDTASMATRDLAKLSQFFADVTANSSKYGGEDNEIIKVLNKMNEDWSSTAKVMQENATVEDRQEIEWYLQESKIAQQALQSGSKGYTALLNNLGNQFGEETARAVLKNYFKAEDVQRGEVINTFAKTYGFDTAKLQNSLEGFADAEKALEAIGQKSELMAAALEANGQSFEGLTDYIQLCIDKIDIETFGDKLASIQKLLNSLDFGDLIDKEQYNQLIEQFGKEVVSKYVAVLPSGEYRVINDISELRSEAAQQAKDIVDNFRKQGAEKSIAEAQRLMDEFEWGNLKYDDKGNKLDVTKTNMVEVAQTKSNNINDLIEQNQKDIERINKIRNYLNGNTLSIDKGNLTEARDILKKGIFGEEESKNISEKDFIEYLKNAGITTDATSNTNTKFYIDNATAGQNQIDQKTQEITNLTAEKTEIDNKIKAWAELNGLIKEYQQLAQNPYALEDKLINSSTTFEELQSLVDEGYISNEKYQKSITTVAAASAEALNLDKEALIEQAKYLEKNNKYVQGSLQSAMDLALAYQRQSKALTDLNSNVESYTNAIEKSEKGSKEYTSAMNSLEEDMQNLFNTDETIGEDFILKHLSDIEKAANNDIKAIKRLQEAYVLNITSQDGDFTQKQIDEIQEYIDSINWEDLEIGVGVDTQPALQALWNLYEEALKSEKITKKQFQEIWNGMGYELVPIWGKEKVYTHAPSEAVAQGALEYVERDVIVGYKPKYAGNAKASTSSSTKKGGGGKSRSKKDKKELKDEKERYYVISRQLQDQLDIINKLDKAKSRAWGKAKLDYIDRETEALEKELDIQKQYLKEIEDYYKLDQENLNFFGAKYDENGVVTNYDEMIEKELKRYNDAVKKYNSGKMSEAEFNKASQRYEDFKKKLKQYDDTNELYQKKLEEIQQLEYEIYDKALEKITTKVEMDIQVNDAELEKLEYDLDRIQKKAFSTAESIAKMSEQLGTNLSSQTSYDEAVNQILANHGIASINDISNLSDDTIANLGFTEDEVNTLLDYNSSLLDTQKTIDELQESIIHGMVDAFEEWNEEFDYQQNKIASNIDLLKQYQDIADLIYSNSPGVTNQFITDVMGSQYAQMVNGVEAAYARLASQRASLEQAKAEYERLIASGASEQTLTAFRNDLREMESEVENSQSDMLKKTEEALKQAEDIFKKAVEDMSNNFKEMVKTSDWDMTKFDRLKKLDEQYLDDYEKIYEFSKLTRDINNSIDDADTIRQKERLREITQEIADIEASGKEVSQFEVDALRKKYELRLAEIALEDAQAAKQTVRMSRDNDGNWSYVYTADEDNVDKARQNYEDKLYEYQKLNSEFIKEQQENFLNLENQYVEEMTKIAQDSSLNEEDKERRLQETQEYYQRMAEIMSDQLGIAIDKNSELYNKDWLDYSKTTGYKISKLEDYQTKIEDTYTGVLQPNVESASDLLKQFTEATVGEGGYFPSIMNALGDFELKQEEVLNAAGTTLADYADLVSGAMKTAEQSSKDAAESVEEAAKDMRRAFDDVINKINDVNNQKLDKLRTDISNTVGQINILISKYKELSRQMDEVNKKKNNSGVNKTTYSANTTDDSNKDRTPSPTAEEKNIYKAYGVSDKSLYDLLTKLGVKNQGSDDAYNKYMTAYEGAARGGDKSLTTFWSNNKKTDLVKNVIKQLKKDYKDYKEYEPSTYDTGGYTGSWGSEGRLAMLHQKELVLNAHDTENMLNTIQMVRDIVASIDVRAAAAGAVNINNAYASAATAGPQNLNQNVHIEANFPNATDHNEIELALTNLVNRASQYVGRKNL